MKLINDLFVNLSILGTLLFVFSLLARKQKGFMSPRVGLRRKIQYGVYMGMLGVIVMHYTIPFNNTILDFRQIPVVVAAVYGGRVPPIVASVLIAVGRIAIFGVNNASIMAAILIVIIGLACGLLSQLNINLGKKWLVMTLSNLTLTSIVFYVLIHDWKVLINIYAGFWAFSLIGGVIVHLLCEYMRQTKEVFQAAQENAAKDFLTGLNNARKFDQVLQESFQKADRHQENMSFILLDIDHFKRVNDTSGHLAGDQVLKQLANILMDCCRSIDIVSRNGGEEFSVILPSCNNRQALEIAERIRLTVEKCEFLLSTGSTLNITVSLGISTYRETTFQREQMFKQADDCLYVAKRTGRNKAVRAECGLKSDSVPMLSSAVNAT